MKLTGSKLLIGGTVVAGVANFLCFWTADIESISKGGLFFYEEEILFLVTGPIVAIFVIVQGGLLFYDRKWRPAFTLIACPFIFLLFVFLQILTAGGILVDDDRLRLAKHRAKYEADLSSAPISDGYKFRAWDWGSDGLVGSGSMFTLVYDGRMKWSKCPNSVMMPGNFARNRQLRGLILHRLDPNLAVALSNR